MASVSSNVYQDVIDWALSRQVEQQQGGDGQLPLTVAQRKALLDLHQVIKPPGSYEEPELGNMNWVGLLHRWRDAHPDTSGVSFVEHVIDVQPVRFRSTVSIKESNQPIPGPGCGLLEGREPPSFNRKKDAKQYAAKCAIEWLRVQQLMPRSGDEVKFPKSVMIPSPVPSPKPKRQKTSSSPLQPAAESKQQQQCSRASTSSSSLSTSSPRKSTPAGAAITTCTSPLRQLTASPSSTTNEVSAVQLVAQKCQDLNIVAPRYVLEEQKDARGFWSGRPVFQSWQASDFPEGLGHVRDIMGKNNAKERIAEELLKHLQQVEEARNEKARIFLAGLPPVKTES